MKKTLTRNRRIELHTKDLGIESIVEIGRLHYHRADPPLARHVHENALEIVYLAKGKQTYEVYGDEFHLTGGDLFLTYPNEPHGSGGHPEERSLLYWVILSLDTTDNPFLDSHDKEGDLLCEKLKELNTRKCRGSAEISAVVDKLLTVQLSDSPCKKLRIRSLLTEFLFLVISSVEKHAGSNVISSRIQQVKTRIDESVFKTLTLEQLAEHAGLSLSRFKQRFRDETGIPPGEYISRQKIKKAKEMLLKGIAVGTISTRLKFSSSQYFATVFRRYTGVSPKQFWKE